jgi:hypothetical protein
MKKDLKSTIASSTGFLIAASILVLGIAVSAVSNISIPAVSAMTMMPGNQTAGHGATSNMTAGSASMASTAKMHLEEGMKALQSGDTQGAMMHLKVADKILGGTG